MLHSVLHFFGRSQKATPFRIPPSHANGHPMTRHEQEIWAQMQNGVDRHWDKIAQMGQDDRRSFLPGQHFQGEVLRIYGGSRLVFMSAAGEWEAPLKDGVVGIPRKISD